MNIARLLGATALAGATLVAAPAFAQDGAAQTQTNAPACDTPLVDGRCLPLADETRDGQADAGGTNDVVVTGSRIRRPNLESTVPITSVAGEQFFQTGDTNIGDTLNELPQLRSTFAQQNPGLGIGIAGLNLLDLRGLGTQRTLVLVNGRRHVAADILNNAVSPDVNTIPNDLIERVDIVTGGNSAVYGSDAIAGVVNFVLRRDFNGLQIRGVAGATEQGFGGNQYISAMVGKNFAEGKGNITLHGEYSRQNRVFGSDIDSFRRVDGLGVVDADSGGLTNNSDGIPDRVFIRDIRSASIYFGGLTPINQRVGTSACGVGTLANNGGSNSNGNPYNCSYLFTGADGRLVQQTGSRYGAGIIGGITGGNGQTGREGQLLSVLPFLERYNTNLLAHYEFSKAAEIFVEAKWNRVNSVGNNAGPSFNQGTGGTGDFRERVRLDNPFLNPADRTTLASLILASGCRTDLQVVCPAAGNLTAADRTAIADGSFRFVNSRVLADVGLRDEHFQRDTYRIVGGLRGTFNDDWSYEFSANYGKFKEDVTTDGYIDRQRFSLAMDAGRNPVTGQVQCRSQFDPAAAVIIQRAGSGDTAANQARLAADIAACVPYNPFGTPNNTASVGYFAREFTAKSSLDQLDLTGFVSGDISQLFELPGGPISFALGGEYRREQASYEQDQFVVDGFTNGVSIPSFKPKAFKVTEGFGEVRVPILKDMPFFHELTLSGAGRVSKYQGSVGTVYSYNGGVDYAPIQDIRFRFNYSRAVRAPNVSETGFPLVPNFQTITDPCNPSQRNSGANRAANCQADLGTLLPLLTDLTQSLAIVSGSNPNLTEEKSDSYTVGTVIQPRMIPGFSLSVDYYNITVNGIITSLSAQGLVNSCYDAATINNVFCGQFTRNRATTVNSLNDQPGRIVSNSLILAPVNFAKRVREGIDVNASYRRDLGAVKYSTNLVYTHNLTISNFQDPVTPNFEDRILQELGDPKDEFRWDNDFEFGALTLGYRLRYIGPMYVNLYENFNGLNQGLPGATPAGGGDADYADVRKYKTVTYSDLRFEFNILHGNGKGGDLRFYGGVDNVFNQQPPLGSTATGAGSAIYEFRGRNFYAGFRARF
jgi:outer membrane receptor protein involved in Fe transport